MIFTDLVYPVFLLAAVLVHWLLPRPARPWWLALAGTAFYAYYAPEWVWLVLGLALATWALSRSERRPLTMLAVALPLLALAWFKYRHMLPLPGAPAWLVPTAGGSPGEVGPVAASVYLPLALSFFTFEFVHVAIDSRRGDIRRPPLRDFLAFAMFFPTMVAGPIKRFEGFSAQIDDNRLTAEDVGQGLTRILSGAVKKVVLADSLALLVRPLVSDAFTDPSMGAVAVALVAYSLRIYLDFSGYSDIAIGSARLFGYRVPENFRWPYLATNIAGFWRRWHMSLTSWIVDYVYVPLGGNRRGLGRTVVNSFAAMAVSGLWHGADWHFLAWGLYHGALLSAYRVWSKAVRPRLLGGLDEAPGGLGGAWRATRVVRSVASSIVTFALVTFGWGLFVMPVREFASLLARAWGGGWW